MKRIIVMALILVYGTLFAQEKEQKTNYISVQGSVELKEIANQATLNFSVKGVGASLRQAVENADKNTKIVTNKLIALGIKEKNIATSSFFSGENYGDKQFLSSNRDYQASITTIIKVDSLKLLQPVIFAISESDVQNMSQITFSLKDEVGFKRKARIEAVLKAREKAEDMTKALDVTLGKVISIDEIQPSQNISMNASSPAGRTKIYGVSPFNAVVGYQVGAVDESIGTGFFAQTISITSQVFVVFEIK